MRPSCAESGLLAVVVELIPLIIVVVMSSAGNNMYRERPLTKGQWHSGPPEAPTKVSRPKATDRLTLL